ncbi:hypothetical protein [Aquibium sp. ELW1220]|uniref:hypothetical protein n=1 Tax=Aquibium sp. ELW1220 TaxID=2976766 RepID=UPI0025B223D2|nr:hypothetical protein [Aquibium sp. ELW1220]MDN2580879.1 hypothetical protein [Aquibium sp. ELW1220]
MQNFTETNIPDVINNRDTASIDYLGARYSHETTSRKGFRSYIADVLGGRGHRGLTFRAPYEVIEYFNTPAGLIVFGHRGYLHNEQVDGIHPASITNSIDRPQNISEPFCCADDQCPAYNVHYMTRKSQGIMLMEAWPDGRPAYEISPENLFKIDVDSGGFYSLEAFKTPLGPIVAVFEPSGIVHVIRPENTAIAARL